MVTGVCTGTTITTMDDPATLHRILAMFSPAYPVGSFAHSHGLEAAIADGTVAGAEDLRRWITTILRHGAGRNDAILLAGTYVAPDRVAELSELAQALASSRERHLETMAQGRAFAAVSAKVYGTDPAPHAFPVAVAVVAVVLNLPLKPVVTAYLHAFAANLVSAAVRFVPLGQTEGQRVLAALFAIIDDVAAGALTATTDDLGSATLAADLAAIDHETLPTRIFRT